MKHTRGPWMIEVDEDSPYGDIVSPGTETMIARIIGNGQKLEEVMANARLIAQAPAMLQALKHAAAQLRLIHGDIGGDYTFETVLLAEGIIQKAEKGESNHA